MSHDLIKKGNIYLFWPLSCDFSMYGSSILCLNTFKKSNVFSRFSCSQNFFNNQMAALLFQLIPNFCAKFSKKILLSVYTYESNIASEEYCIAHRNDKMCFLTDCRYHIILLAGFKDLIQKLNAVSSTHKHVNCFHTPFIYQFSGKIIVRSGKVFNIP